MASNSDKEEKVTFITGSTRGIGWETAKLFAKKGMTVLLNGVSDEKLLNNRVSELKENYACECQGFLFDVSDVDEVKKCYQAVFKKYKRLDVLVNNAGIFKANLLGMIMPDEIDRIIDVNVKGVLYNMQYASRLMARNQSGSIINLTSIMGRRGDVGQILYSGSKSAVIGITLAAAKELATYNIRVNAVAPGFINTDMANDITEEKMKERIDSIKMKRIGSSIEVANSIYYFASDLSTYVTGQVLGVDGGMVI